jgi:hypothetical protein
MAKAKGSQRTITPLVVRYPRRMRPHRVHTVTVGWRSLEKPRLSPGTGPFTVRLIMPGTQVVPTEQPIDPSKPTARATFYVTPLARRGWLRGERLEVLYDGEKLQEIGLPTKVVSQLATWILLFLTIFLPSYYLNEVKFTAQEKARMYAEGGPWVLLVNNLKQDVPIVVQAGEWAHDNDLDLDFVRSFYTWFHALIIQDEVFGAKEKYDANIALWLAGIFLILTIVSWLTHREKIVTKSGQPLAMPEEE